jgi:hypothetical protein
MIIMHYSDKPHSLPLSRFAEKLNGFKSFRDIMSDKNEVLHSDVILQPYEVRVLELIK